MMEGGAVMTDQSQLLQSSPSRKAGDDSVDRSPGFRLGLKQSAATFFVLLIALLFQLIPGCATNSPPSTQPSSAYDTQEQAMKDPMNYSPDMSRTDITGGGTADYRKDSIKKDWDDFWNP
jgi:hypothetical protein